MYSCLLYISVSVAAAIIAAKVFFTGSGNNDKNSNYVHHHSMFDLDEDAMVSGLSMFMKILELEQVIKWS